MVPFDATANVLVFKIVKVNSSSSSPSWFSSVILMIALSPVFLWYDADSIHEEERFG